MPLHPRARVQASLASLVSTVGLLLRRSAPVVPQSNAQAVRPVRPQGHVRSSCPKTCVVGSSTSSAGTSGDAV